MTLALVADASKPFDYSLLPPGVVAIAGYIGGDTPHVWTLAEVAGVHATGRDFWPIWTAPSRGQAIDAIQGGIDGAAAVRSLAAYGLPATLPVFYDVEYADWAANPATALQAILAFKRTVVAGGHPNVFAYVPYTANFDWVAYWDNVEPTDLPAGWVGQQYGGNAVGGAADLSAFDLGRLGMDVTLSQTTIDAIGAEVTQHLGLTVGNLQHEYNEIAAVLADVQDAQAKLATLLTEVGQLLAAAPGGGAPASYTGTVELTPKSAG